MIAFISKTGCRDCQALLELLPQGTVTHDVGTFEGLAEYHAALDGLSTVPVLIDDKTTYVGADAIAHLQEIAQ